MLRALLAPLLAILADTEKRKHTGLTMNDPNEQIQAAPRSVPQKRTRSAGTLFGFLAGIPFGMLTAAVSCWIVDDGDFWRIALYGAIIGSLGGAVIGFSERTLRGELARPDIATFIGATFGLLPAILILGLSNGFAGRLFIGILFAGPMAGLLIGAVYDRIFEAIMQKSWSSAIGFAICGVGLCVGGVFLIDAYGGPDPKKVAQDAQKLIAEHWAIDPGMEGVKIDAIKLTHRENRTFTGIMDVSVHGREMQYDVEVEVRRGTIKPRWIPRN